MTTKRKGLATRSRSPSTLRGAGAPMASPASAVEIPCDEVDALFNQKDPDLKH